MKIVNKKGLHDYYVIDVFEAGVKLLGSEVKSIKSGRIELSESYIKIINGQLVMVNANIPQYQNSSDINYRSTRDRVLLVHQNQISGLIGKISHSGFTLIPISVYLIRNLIKVEVGIAKSKKMFDKRRLLKEKDNIRKIERELTDKN